MPTDDIWLAGNTQILIARQNRRQQDLLRAEPEEESLEQSPY